LVANEVRREIEKAGYRVVPAVPSKAMLEAGAPLCFQAYSGSWATAIEDAAEIYAKMIGAALDIELS
jgi:hypothetical protein